MADDSFSDNVRADVILELVGAPHFPANLTALNPRGRIVVVGVGAGSKVEFDLGADDGPPRRAARHGAARPLAGGQGARACARSSARSCRTWRRGACGRCVDRVYPAEKARDAYDRLAGSGKSGKVLLDFGD